MGMNKPQDGAPGTTDQSPRWEGPEASRPRGYLPAKDDPDTARDAVGETNKDPERSGAKDAMKVKGDRPGQSPAVRSLHEEQSGQAQPSQEGRLQKGLEDTFPASDPVSASSPSTVKKHVAQSDATKLEE